MQYLISNPNTVSVSSSKKKQKDTIFKKKSDYVYIYLTDVKDFVFNV